MDYFHDDLVSRIVLLSSKAYRQGAFNYIPYSAAKGAIAGMVRAYARKLGPKVIINGLAPGIVESPMASSNIKIQGEKLIQEMASVIYFLLTEDSSYINGQIINVDGGTVFS